MRNVARYKWGVVLCIMLILLSVSACEKPEEASAEVYDNKAEANWVLLTIDYPEQSGIEDLVDYKVYYVSGEITPINILQYYGETSGTPVVLSEETSEYVQGIAGVFENDYNNPSGWSYTVNEVSSIEEARDCQIVNEDRVKWSYVSYAEANI